MKNGARKVDGYAVQNTTHVLCALRVYLVRASASGPGEAEQAAIECYAALSGRLVDPRSIRRWLTVVKSYGSIEKTPENAFGALKSCPHVHRPFRRRLREMEAETERLAKGNSNPISAQTAVELALIERDMASLVSRFQNAPFRYSLLTIRRLARRLATVPIHRLHQKITASELEHTLDGLLGRMKTLASKTSGKASALHE